MDNQETISCFNDVKESFLNVLSVEELHLLTPRYVRDTIDSWATASTDKERVQELIFEWLEDEYPGKKDELSPEDKNKRLLLAVSQARRYIDFILTDHAPTDDGRKNFRIAEEKDDAVDKRFMRELQDWEEYYGVEYYRGADEGIDRLNKRRGKNVSAHLQDIAKRGRMPVKQGKHHGKCDVNEYKENMYQLLDMAMPADRNNETRLINLLDEMGYGHSDELNGYYYLFSFLSELIRYEFVLCKEIKPYESELKSFKRYKHKPTDEEMSKRLDHYKKVGIRNKHRHSATLNSDKWAIPFKDFAKLYRKILGLQKRALLTPLK